MRRDERTQTKGQILFQTHCWKRPIDNLLPNDTRGGYCLPPVCKSKGVRSLF